VSNELLIDTGDAKALVVAVEPFDVAMESVFPRYSLRCAGIPVSYRLARCLVLMTAIPRKASRHILPRKKTHRTPYTDFSTSFRIP
jgi:hypothetical protein